MNVESKLDKVARRFQRKLTEDEVKFRLASTKDVISELRKQRSGKIILQE